MTDVPTFYECLIESAGNNEFVSNYNRLAGKNFGQSLTRKPIERMIDEATGACPEPDLAAFAAFVHEFVYLPLQPTSDAPPTAP